MLIKWVLWHVQSVLISDLNQLEVIIACSCIQRYVSHQASIVLVIILQLCHVTCLSQLITDAIVPVTSLLCTDCVKSSRSLPKHSSHLSMLNTMLLVNSCPIIQKICWWNPITFSLGIVNECPQNPVIGCYRINPQVCSKTH